MKMKLSCIGMEVGAGTSTGWCLTPIVVNLYTSKFVISC